jgi:hypothetical protein
MLKDISSFVWCYDIAPLLLADLSLSQRVQSGKADQSCQQAM